MRRQKSTAVALPQEVIMRKIFVVRGEKVILDSDIATLYGVATKQLKRQVKRNADRFPVDFMFTLTEKEFHDLRCQNGTSKRGGVRYMPMVFTEQGVAMLASVLNSKRAIMVSIHVVRTFVKIREMMETHMSLSRRMERLSRKVATHEQLITALIGSMSVDEKTSKRKIGFI